MQLSDAIKKPTPFCRSSGGFACEAVPVETLVIDPASEDTFASRREKTKGLESKVNAAPRGHYALVKTLHEDKHTDSVAISDGKGNGPATGGAYDIYTDVPNPETLLRRMVTYEIYLCRKAVERSRYQAKIRIAQQTFGFAAGATYKGSIDISGKTFSSATITEVIPETGILKLLLRQRGSRHQWTAEIDAALFAERAGLNDALKLASQPATGSLF